MAARTTGISVLGMAAWIGVSLLAGLIGSRFMPGTWYASLAKPAWTPPGWLFGPVWTVLYVLMGVAAWRVWWLKGFRAAAAGLALFLFQLILNSLWSRLFFGLHRPDLALVDIVLLWIAILATAIAFWKHSPVAGAMLLPYLAWVSFATALNAAIWHLNR